MYGMPNKPQPVCLFLCNGGACQKQSKAYAGLQREAQSASLTFASISCHGSCSGPTAVVIGPDGPRWFENLRGKAVRRDLIALVDGATSSPHAAATERLRKRELTGKRRTKAQRRFAKATQS